MYLFLALAVALLAAWPLLSGPGIINTRAGGDAPFLLQRVHGLAENLRAGIFPARWMPDAAYGLGYPAYNFYAVFPYYVAALLDLAGFGVLWGLKLTQALGFLLAAWGLYRLARELGASREAAFLGSAVYTVAPFHLLNVYVRGDSLSEFYAFALYPLIIWAVIRLRQRPSPERVAGLALSYALLILTHNISALIFSPLIALWLLVEAFGQRQRARWGVLLAGGMALGLGLALSAWFWAPALREQALVQLQGQTTGYFDYQGHFRTTDLVAGRLLHDYTIDKLRDPFRMGLVQALIGVAGLAVLVVRSLKQRRLAATDTVIALALLGSTWLITPASRWVWAHVPLLPFVQFPWRFLSIQAFAIGLLAAQIPALVRGLKAHALALGLAALALVAGMAGLRHPGRLAVSEADITPQRLMLYETYSGNIGTTIRWEYLPRDMLPRPYGSAVQLNAGNKPAPLAIEGELRSAQLMQRTPETEDWQIDAAAPSLLAFHTTYFPAWTATVDGQAQAVEPLAGLGLVGLRLTAGTHQVRLRWEPTPVRRYATWLSLGGLVLWLGLALYPTLRSRRYRLGALGVVGVLGVGGLWLGLAPGLLVPSQPVSGPLVMDFAWSPYLHAEPEGIVWNDVRLRDYTLSATTLRPGETLRLTLAWDGAHPDTQAEVEIISANAHLFRPSPTWVKVVAPITSERTEVELPLPADLPPGLYVPHIEIVRGDGDFDAQTARGDWLSHLAFQPIQVVSARRATMDETVLASFGPERAAPVISLVKAGIYGQKKGQLEVALTWRSERQAPLNYMLSVRLKRADGRQLDSRDLPPLLGAYPTSLWQPGELVSDRVILSFDKDEAVTPDDVLEIVLYDRLTLQAAGTVTLRLADLPPSR